MNKIILNQHPAWSGKTAARSRLDGWTLYHTPAAPPAGEDGAMPDGQNPPDLRLVEDAVEIPLEI